MIKIKTLNLHTEQEEVFIVSSSIGLHSFKDNLQYIKHGTRGIWIRPERKILEVIENYKPMFCNELKYICMENENGAQEIVVFSKSINHDFMFDAVQYVDENFRKKLSAGFTNGLACYGRSETLNLDSNPDHFKLII